jgi:hypothetical protein
MANLVPTCGGAAGTGILTPGTLEILSLDAASVSVSFDLAPLGGWPDGNGDYTASFCP